MKNIKCFFCLIVLSTLLISGNIFAVSANAAETADYAAITNNIPTALIYDVTADSILYSKNSTTRIRPASTTKLVTALVVMKYADPEEIFTVGSELFLVPYNSSACYISRGQRLKTKTLLAGLLIRSGGDAAYTLAVNIARKCAVGKTLTDKEAVEYFAALMNEYCAEIGCTGSNFVSPDGWDYAGTYTTASDMLIIAKEVLKNETLTEITKTAGRYFYFASGEKIYWENRNLLLQKNSGYYCPYATGLKTGTTNGAGNCLISSAEKDSRQILVLLFGCKDNDTRFRKSKEIIETVFSYPYLKGDADKSGGLSASDARLALRTAVGLEKTNEYIIITCDIDNDGIITATDARMILRASVGIEELK